MGCPPVDKFIIRNFFRVVVKIAAKTNCPIIPMAISGSADIWENHFPRVKKTHVILEYGKPIYIDQLEKEDKKHLGAYTQNIIHEMLVKNKAQL